MRHGESPWADRRPEKEKEPGEQLGRYLASLRTAKGLTLRQVEDATERKSRTLI